METLKNLKKHNYEILFQQKKDVQPLPFFGDQPFIVYHAFKNNLYDNQKLIKIVTDNPNMFNNQTISHFPGGPGDYNSKIKKIMQRKSTEVFILPNFSIKYFISCSLS